MDHEKIRQGHIDRFLAGKDVWNEWAEEMLREKEALETAGKWVVRDMWHDKREVSLTISKIPETQNWLDRAFVDFSALHFLVQHRSDSEVQKREITQLETDKYFKSIPVNSDVIDFSGFLFPGDAWFTEAKFRGTARFDGAKFTGDAWFTEAKFRGTAWFTRAKFTGTAWFTGAKFTGTAWFTGAKFTGTAWFNEAKFTGDAWFSGAKFTGEAQFEGAKFTGNALFEGAKFTGNALFEGAKFTGNALFEGAKFTGNALFEGAKFTGNALFEGAKFTGNALFEGAKFTGTASFEGAKFTGTAWFSEAEFTGDARFTGAKYTGAARFDGAMFTGDAWFNQADFKSFTNFKKSRFQYKSNFEAIHVERGFSLEDAEFTTQVPSFIQAHFKEAPRLDNMTVLAVPKVGPPLKWRRYFWQKKLMQAKARCFRKIVERVKFGWQRFKNFRRDKDEEARYRALKRLAIQAHDHDNEQKFFAGEMRARRHIRDFANPMKGIASSVRYWAGVLYELSSDFGRSIWRPLLIWIGVCYLFSWLYLAQSDLPSGEKCLNSPSLTTSEAANTISYKNAILFISADRTDKLKRAYSCLYGASPLYPVDQGKTDLTDFIKDHGESARIGPNVPYMVAKFGILHSLLSAVLIFLLLLGVRNQFKIK